MSFKGKVKTFQAERGFGFVIDPKGGPDIFLHQKYIVDGKQPKKGDMLLFDKEKQDNGKSSKFEARNVTGGTGQDIVQQEHQERDSKPCEASSSKDATAANSKAVCVSSHRNEQALYLADAATDVPDSSGATDVASSVCAGDFDSLRSAYDELGSEAYYKTHAEDYRNPHEPAMARAMLAALDEWRSRIEEQPLRRVHDLAAGSGEASVTFARWQGCVGCSLDASDPYTYRAFEKRLGRPAYQWSFEDIAGGVMDDLQPYDLVLATFSLHLVDKSYQHTALAALARSCRLLLVATPHKRPEITASTGWRQVQELVQDRVRVRLYVSDGARRLEQDVALVHSEYSVILQPPKLEEENEQAAAEIIDDSINIQAVVSKMNNYELREALVKRGLSTTGKRTEWGDRLIAAVLQQQQQQQGCQTNAQHDAVRKDFLHGSFEALEEEDEEEKEAAKEEDDEDEESSAYDDSEEEEESDEASEASTNDDSDGHIAAAKAKRAAVKAALSAARAAKQQAKRTMHKPRTGEKRAEPKKKMDEATRLDFKGEKVKATRLQDNFGQTKFIKP